MVADDLLRVCSVFIPRVQDSYFYDLVDNRLTNCLFGAAIMEI